MEVRVALLGVQQSGRDAHLRLEVTAGEVTRETTVKVAVVRNRVQLAFPHLDFESGMSFGDEALDAAIVGRAELIVSFLEAAGDWSAFRRQHS